MKNTKKQTNNFTIFDWLKEVTYNKTPWNNFTNDQIKSFEPYMVNRFLSMNSDYLELVNYIQTIPYTEKEKYYRIYCDLLPKKQFWSKYIKSSTKQPNKDLIQYLTVYFECGSSEVMEYIELLGKDGITNCLTAMGIDDKEIKKLLK